MNYIKHIFTKFFWFLFNRTKYHNCLTRYEIQKSFNKAMTCDVMVDIKTDMTKRQTFFILNKCRKGFK